MEKFVFIPVTLPAGNKNAEKPVVAVYKCGKFCRFPNMHTASRMMNVPVPNIVACAKGRLKTAGGYRWFYADQFSWKDVCGTQPQREDV